MDSERWKHVEDVLQAAPRRAPEERDAFLRSACAVDEALEREVRSLLKSEEQAGAFLESPAMEVAARAIAQLGNMNPERWRQIEALYHAAREGDRAVLADANPGLRREVEALLSQPRVIQSISNWPLDWEYPDCRAGPIRFGPRGRAKARNDIGERRLTLHALESWVRRPKTAQAPVLVNSRTSPLSSIVSVSFCVPVQANAGLKRKARELAPKSLPACLRPRAHTWAALPFPSAASLGLPLPQLLPKPFR